MVEERGDLSPKNGEESKGDEITKAKPVEPYKTPIFFPQRLAKAKLKSVFGKFLEVLKKLHINILFMDDISRMPSQVQFVHDMLSNKRKF